MENFLQLWLREKKSVVLSIPQLSLESHLMAFVAENARIKVGENSKHPGWLPFYFGYGSPLFRNAALLTCDIHIDLHDNGSH